METRSKHLRIESNLFNWLQVEAQRQNRSVNAEIIAALKYWKETRPTMLHMPEEKDLNIGIADIEWDRKIIKEYEDKIASFEAKANESAGPRKGAYLGQITKTKKALDAMSGNLAYHLDWLRRHRPAIYDEVKGEVR